MQFNQFLIFFYNKLIDAEDRGDWLVVHGRSVALAVGLRSAAEKLAGGQWADKVVQVALTHCVADRVPITNSGLRAVGYLLKHQLKNGRHDVELITVLPKVSLSNYHKWLYYDAVLTLL